MRPLTSRLRAPLMSAPRADGPHIVVLSSLYPSARQPTAGLFIRERISRIGKQMPIAVVAPSPWFPLQPLLRRLRPGFRPGAPRYERHGAIEVWYPRFLSIPGFLKQCDGWLMAACSYSRLRALKDQGRLDVIDAHFGFPDGYAATLLGKWLGVPVAVTLRGTEERHARDPTLREWLIRTLQRVDRVFTVSASLRQLAVSLGIDDRKIRVVPNGVDSDMFHPIPKSIARAALGLPADPETQWLVTVGGLVERKGFHRVIECLPKLRDAFPKLGYLVIGGPSPEGNWSDRLKNLASSLGVLDRLRFLGTVAPGDLHRVLSAADVFVLSTRNEGWANVLLEAMACGLPVVTTDVGGNKEVVCSTEFGTIVPFDDHDRLCQAIERALQRDWDREAIRRYAEHNEWGCRIEELQIELRDLASSRKRA